MAIAGPWSKTQHIAAAVIVFLCCALIVDYCFQVWPLVWSGLFLDYWNDYDIIASAFSGHLSWGRLLVLQSGDHMILLPRLLFIADFFFAHGSNFLIVAIDFMLMAAIVLLIVYGERKVDDPALLTAVVLLLATTFIFNHANTFNILYSSNTQWFMAAFFCVAALFCCFRCRWRSTAMHYGTTLLLCLAGMLCSRAAWSVIPAIAAVFLLERRWISALAFALIAVAMHALFMMTSDSNLNPSWLLAMLLIGWGLFADMHVGFVAQNFGDTAAWFAGRGLMVAAVLAPFHYVITHRSARDPGRRFLIASLLYGLLTIIGISLSRAWMEGLPQGDRFQLNAHLSDLFIALYWLRVVPWLWFRMAWLAAFLALAISVNTLKYPEMQTLSARIHAEHAEFLSGHADRDKQYPSGWGKDPLLFDAEKLFAERNLAYYYRAARLAKIQPFDQTHTPSCVWQMAGYEPERSVLHLVSNELHDQFLLGYILLWHSSGVIAGYGAFRQEISKPGAEAVIDIWLKEPLQHGLSGYQMVGEHLSACTL